MGKVGVSSGSERLLLVLTALGARGAAMSAADLTRDTGLPASTIYRQLAMLRDWGFVRETRSGHVPGPACLQLIWGNDDLTLLKDVAEPILAELSEQTGETVGLMVASGDHAVCAAMIETPRPLRCSFVTGARIPLTAGASAKALLTTLDPAEIRRIHARLSAHGLDLPDYDSLEAISREVVACGYVTSQNEIDDGVWGVSAPIDRKAAGLPAALTVMVPGPRAKGRKAELIKFTCAAANRLSDQLETMLRGAAATHLKGGTK